MNKIFGLALVVAIVIGIIPYAKSDQFPAPPSGVAADHWIPMGDAAGFVITGHTSDQKNGLKVGGTDQVEGYFLVRMGRTWSRVNTANAGYYHTALDGR